MILLLLLTTNLYASFFEFYGAGAFSTARANQSALATNDAENNYFHPALLAWNKKLLFSASASSVSSEFKPISGIVTKNSTNSTTNETGSARTDYGASYHTILHASLPIAYEGAGPLSLSFVSPFGDIAETNSGDARLPEYVMYHARHKRTQVFLTYAQPLSDVWGLALGTHIGFQATADVSTQASLNGASYNSSAAAKSKITPSLGAIVSLTRKHDGGYLAATFQQEMKSNLQAKASGEINEPTSVLFNIALDSMIYYDPHIFRFTLAERLLSNFELTTTLEYQMWSNYKPPTIFIKRDGGSLLPSSDFENLKTKDIPVLRLAGTLNLTDDFDLLAGAFYRPTPLEGDFSGSGNSIDTDVVGVSGGFSHQMQLLGKNIKWGLGIQYHMLKEQNVSKTTGQENGSAGSKIGAPGYKIGGEVLTGSIGARMMF